MKDIMNCIPAYFAFDRPLEIGAITATFAKTHEQQQKIIPNWGVDSTRQKLISNYWFTDVKGHFAAILGLSFLLDLLITHSFNKYTLVVVLIAAIFSFLVMLFFTYLPMYTSDFLPKLNTIKTIYESRQQKETIKQLQEQISAQQIEISQQQQLFQNELNDQHLKQQQLFQVSLQQELEASLLNQQEKTQRLIQEEIAEQKELIVLEQKEKKKCRQAQMSNLSLALVYYVMDKLAGINKVGPDKHSALLLQKLYGVDQGSLLNYLAFIAGTSGKKGSYKNKKLTISRDMFEDAINFFNEMGSTDGARMVKELEIKLLDS